MAGATRFERLSKLGEGGMGIVYEALDRERNMRVALKTLRRVDPANLYRFKREFRVLSDLSHPNIIALYELVSEGEAWYLSMELIEGEDFLGHVHRPNAARVAVRSSTKISTPSDITVDTRVIAPPAADVGARVQGGHLMPAVPDEKAELTELVDLDKLMDALPQLAQALYALHTQGIIHRDLKPSNVRVTRDGRVVLMDFGIVAETMSEGGADNSAPLMGTPAYMAPEQATNAPPSAAADWYAFGVLIYEALTCRLPFRGPRGQILVAKRQYDPMAPSAFVTGIPESLERLCVQLLSRDPESRPQGYEVLTTLGVAAESISHLMSEVTFIGLNEFVGRSALLRQLEQAFQRCLVEGAVFVIAHGVSGMGKTTLLRRFIYELEATQIGSNAPIFLAGRCHERESLSYKAFDGVIDQLSRELLELPEHIVRSLLPADMDLLARIFPVLRRVPGVNVSRSVLRSSLDQQRERASNALRAILINLGEWRPVVIRIEDLQWADRDSIELLVEIMRPPAPRRLMFIASRRTDVQVADSDTEELLEQALQQLAEHVICHRVEVGPLSETEQALLVAKLAGERNLPASIGDAYWSEADGNPLLLAELARYASEEPDALRQGNYPRLEDIIARRIARLPEKARRLLDILAIAGEPTPLWLLASVLELSDDERERASSTLRVAKLARVALPGHEPWLNTQHDKIRETVRRGMSVAERAAIHRQLAEALERWDAASVPSLARHWLAAGERERAVEYLLSSAQAAIDKLAFERAAELYRLLLDVHTEGDSDSLVRGDVVAALGHVLAQGGRYREAAEVYSDGVPEAGELRKMEFSRLAAENMLRAGMTEEGIAILGELMAYFGIPINRTRGGRLMKVAMQRVKLAIRGMKYTPRTESEIPARDLERLDTLYAAATSLGMVDRLLGSVVQTQHLRLALQSGEERRICRALAVEVSYLGTLGHRSAKRAEELNREVHRRASELDDPSLNGLTHMGTGVLAYFTGATEQAEQAFERVLEHTEGVAGVEWERITARYFLCQSRFRLGEWQLALDAVQDEIEQAERRGDRYALNLFRSEMSTWYWLLRDRADLARASVETTLVGWSEDAYFLAHHQAAQSLAMIHLYLGEGREAAQRLDGAMERMGSLLLQESDFFLGQLLVLRGRAALSNGDFATVRKCCKRLARLENPSATASVCLLQAPMRIREGDIEAGIRLIAEALAIHGEHRAAHMVAACQYRLGQLCQGAEAEQRMAAALGWMSEQGVENPARLVALLTWGRID